MVTVNARTKRDEILLVAAEIFSEKGYRAATLNDVADAMGFTRAALYYYFENKQEMLTALMEMAGAEHTANLQQHLAADVDVPEKVRRIIVSHVLAVINRPHLFTVFQAEVTELTPEAREQLAIGERGHVAAIAELLSTAMAEGAFRARPPKPVALALLGMANTAARWYRPGRDLGRDEVAELIADLCLDGLNAR